MKKPETLFEISKQFRELFGEVKKHFIEYFAKKISWLLRLFLLIILFASCNAKQENDIMHNVLGGGLIYQYEPVILCDELTGNEYEYKGSKWVNITDSSGYLIISNEPAKPPKGHKTIYKKANDSLYFKDEAGTEIKLTDLKNLDRFTIGSQNRVFETTNFGSIKYIDNKNTKADPDIILIGKPDSIKK